MKSEKNKEQRQRLKKMCDIAKENKEDRVLETEYFMRMENTEVQKVVFECKISKPLLGNVSN